MNKYLIYASLFFKGVKQPVKNVLVGGMIAANEFDIEMSEFRNTLHDMYGKDLKKITFNQININELSFSLNPMIDMTISALKSIDSTNICGIHSLYPDREEEIEDIAGNWYYLYHKLRVVIDKISDENIYDYEDILKENNISDFKELIDESREEFFNLKHKLSQINNITLFNNLNL